MEHNLEHNFQPGEICPECRDLGTTKQLRVFHISLEEQIVKCESDTCLFPYVDEASTDSSDSVKPEQHEPPHLTQLQNCAIGQTVEELLLETNTNVPCETYSVLNYDFTEFMLPTLSPTKPRTNPAALASSRNNKAIVKPKIEIQSVETLCVKNQPKQTTTFQHSTMPTGSSSASCVDDAIPKASISRFYAAMTTTKRPKQTKRKGTTAASKAQPEKQLRYGGINEKKEPPTSTTNPLEIKQILNSLKNKKTTT